MAYLHFGLSRCAMRQETIRRMRIARERLEEKIRVATLFRKPKMVRAVERAFNWRSPLERHVDARLIQVVER